MKIQSIMSALGKGAICLFLPGAAGLLSGCQSPPPVREYRVEHHTDCSPCTRACVTADQNYPDGIRHLAGGPLYYESQNLNWEQAPPFGTW
jgi:hypothetical protein